MRRAERLQVWLAILGACATVLAGLIPSAVELVNRSSGTSDHWISCTASIERVVEIEKMYPAVAHLYARRAGYLPRLFNDAERSACGNPRNFAEEFGRETAAQSAVGRTTSRR